MQQNRVLYYKTEKGVKAMAVKKVKKSLWTGKEYLIFEGKKIPVTEINKSLFFTAKSAMI